jgi:hypothetical protein
MSENGLRVAAVALAPATVLRLLAELAGEGEPPVLKVFLAGGQVLEAELVAVGTDRGSEVVVLADPRTSVLAYVLLTSVVAVELRDPGPFRDVLTGGRLPLPQAGEPVTRLQLQREFAPAEDFPVRVDWAALDGSEPVLANLARLLRGLREVAARVRADELGQRAWEQVRTLLVEHRTGEELAVLRTPDGLAVRADLSAALPRAVTGELYRKISASLLLEDRMGLAERRAVERFKNDDYPGWKARIDQAAGFAVPVEVAWDELAVGDYADSYAEFFPKVYFQPLADALAAVTIDELGKNALRDGLSRIVIRNTGGYYSASGIGFAEGVLTLDHQPHVNIDDGPERAKALQRTLESAL